MFFVRGLSTNGRPVFINPDQVLYVQPVGVLRSRTSLVMTHRVRLTVDQDPETVRQRFDEYLNQIAVHQGAEEGKQPDPEDLEETPQ